MVMQVIKAFEEFEAVGTFILPKALVMSLYVSFESIGAAEDFTTVGQGTRCLH